MDDYTARLLFLFLHFIGLIFENASYFCRFILTNLFLIYLYTNSFQNVDDEEYGGMTEIFKEGMLSSFATFLVWF